MAIWPIRIEKMFPKIKMQTSRILKHLFSATIPGMPLFSIHLYLVAFKQPALAYSTCTGQDGILQCRLLPTGRGPSLLTCTLHDGGVPSPKYRRICRCCQLGMVGDSAVEELGRINTPILLGEIDREMLQVGQESPYTNA